MVVVTLALSFAAGIELLMQNPAGIQQLRQKLTGSSVRVDNLKRRRHNVYLHPRCNQTIKKMPLLEGVTALV